VQVEVPEAVKDFVEQLRQYELVEEELLLKQALNYGMAELRKEYALKLFSQGRLSISEGAELAGLSVGEYLELLVSRGIKSQVTLKDYEEGLGHAEALFEP
jgi:predicted HTH domain antitoxin